MAERYRYRLTALEMHVVEEPGCRRDGRLSGDTCCVCVSSSIAIKRTNVLKAERGETLGFTSLRIGTGRYLVHNVGNVISHKTEGTLVVWSTSTRRRAISAFLPDTCCVFFFFCYPLNCNIQSQRFEHQNLTRSHPRCLGHGREGGQNPHLCCVRLLAQH